MSTTITGPGIPPSAEFRNAEDPTKPLTMAQLEDILLGGGLMGSTLDDIGRKISPSNAICIGTVYACVRIISSAIARMPLITYKNVKGGRVRAKDHPYYGMLKLRPNPAASAFTMKQAISTNLLLWGGAYGELVKDGRGIVEEVIPIEAWRVKPFRRKGQSDLSYEVSMADGSRVILRSDEILHFPGLSFNGVTGTSVISHSRKTLGLADAALEAHGSVFQRGMRPGGILSADGILASDIKESVKKDFETLYSGPKNAGKTIYLPKGLTWKEAPPMPAADAQLLESRKLSKADIAELFGVPPSMLGLLDSPGNNNVEAFSIDFLNYTLAPWLEMIQQEINIKLFGGDEDGEYYAEFLTQVILAMDSTARGNYYSKLFQVGALSPDDIRARENCNALPDGRGETCYVPSNLMPAPTPAQADKLIVAFTDKASKGDPAGKMNPEADGKVAGSSNNT